MKVRNGFVSNSSSSSFVLITTKENYDKVLEDATPLQKFLAGAAGFEKKTAFGKDCLLFSEAGSDDYSFYSELAIDEKLLPRSDYGEDDYRKSDDIHEAWVKFTQALCKNSNESFSYSQSY
jgi:hypothetical protein